MTATNNQEFFREGDWVSGTSVWDEKFIGYVDSAPKLEGGAILVRITQCDRKRLINTLVQTREHRLRKLVDSSPAVEEDWDGLIELALITHDKEWFEELTSRMLAAGSRSGKDKPGGQPRSSRSHPRITGCNLAPRED
ncbi:hypothetical protein [Paenibacillus puerhi]|uniref:hypothetical protein n=1 Tax=Paenibacillus puerhi TaxID=2692622 RepID=UPI0013593AAA|nr:hypothetical protein [Paenibacillus puerhi]